VALVVDRERIGDKVMAMLSELDEAGIVCVSNGSEGANLENVVADRCRTEGRFDQYSIALFFLELMTNRHAVYWKTTSEAILAGKDPRGRCPCGALSTSSQHFAGEWTHRCSAHSFDWRPPQGELFK
jgi:hypothetical protein